jgi:mRNA interferase MazF
MHKDFDTWNERKKKIHDSSPAVFFYEREVWWCAIGANVGYEEDGKNSHFTRPVLVLKKFSKDVFIGVPLSTTTKTGRYYFRFAFGEGESVALLSQVRLFDTKRLVDKMGRVSKHIHHEIRNRIKEIL